MLTASLAGESPGVERVIFFFAFFLVYGKLKRKANVTTSATRSIDRSAPRAVHGRPSRAQHGFKDDCSATSHRSALVCFNYRVPSVMQLMCRSNTPLSCLVSVPVVARASAIARPPIRVRRAEDACAVYRVPPPERAWL